MDVIKLDFEKLRVERQNLNNNYVFKLLQDKNIEELYKNINNKKLNFLLKELELDIEVFLEKCKTDNYFCKIVSIQISKISSRQGILEENKQIYICKTVCKKYFIDFYKLKEHYYCLENGEISLDRKNIYKFTKSFDAFYKYKDINFYVNCKVVFNSGGHQDNVFKELYSLIYWIKNIHNYKNNNKFIILIETNLFEKLNKLKKETQNYENIIFIFNHVEFQLFIHNQVKDAL